MTMLTYDFQMYTALHRQRKGQECERVEAHTGVAAFYIAHTGLQLTVEQVHDYGPIAD